MNLRVLKVPYDSGLRCERMARGPGYLLSHGVFAGESVEAVESDAVGEMASAFDLARQLSPRVRALHEAGELPVILSGNCNSAIGTLCGLGPSQTGVLWFDAHGEFHTPETTTSGFFDGMALAVATGRCCATLARTVPGFEPLPGRHVILAGVRETESKEQAALDRSGVTLLRPPADATAALSQIAAHVHHWYIHLDLDALDPSEATANPWTPPGGLTTESILNLIEEARRLRPIAGVALASLDPASDRDGRALAVARRLLAAATR